MTLQRTAPLFTLCMFSACGMNTATDTDDGTAISVAYATSPAGGDHDGDDHGLERLDVRHVF